MSELRIRYPDESASVRVELIKTWKRGEIDHQIMSTSGGPKEMIRNDIYEVFAKDPEIESVTMVLGVRTMFVFYRKGGKYFDMAKHEVQVTVVPDQAPARYPPGGYSKGTRP